jgi:hypothetical protein
LSDTIIHNCRTMSTLKPKIKRTAPKRDHPRRNRSAAGDPNRPGDYGGTLEAAVRTAYTVIDDYMRRGCDAASLHHQPYAWSDPMNNDDYSQNNWGNSWGPTAPMMAQWAQALQTWTMLLYGQGQGMGGPPGWDQWPKGPGGAYPPPTPGAYPPPRGAVPGGVSGPPPPSANNASSEGMGTGNSPAGLEVSIRVTSECPTEVIPNIGPGPGGTTLQVDPLACLSDSHPSLTGTRAEYDPTGRLIISVTPHVGAVAGEYSGAVKDASGRYVGGLTVILFETS